MVNKKMLKAFSDQVNKEFYSAYYYLSMVSFFEKKSLTGFANWMRIQAKEELGHGYKIYNYLISRGGEMEFETIEAPKEQWETVLDVVEALYEHEQFVTKSIHELMDLAMEEKDHASRSFIQWFVDEQVEEEDNASSLVDKVKFANGEPRSILFIDKELSARTAE